MPGRQTAFGLPIGRTETVDSAAAGPATTTVATGVDPAAAADVGMALRVPAFVVVTLALSLGAHIAAGGGPPSLGSALVIGVLLGIAGRLFALREQSLPRLTALVWSVQAGIHFVLLASHQHGGSHVLAVRLGAHYLHLTPPVAAISAPRGALATQLAGQAATGAAPTTGFGSPLLMLTLHVIAGLAVAAWLRRGEAVVFRAARRILPRLLTHRTPLPVRPSTLRSLPVCTCPRRLKGELFIRLATPRRGPPVLDT
jgi:hypothetical protein